MTLFFEDLAVRLGFRGAAFQFVGFVLLGYGFRSRGTGDDAGMIYDDDRPGRVYPFADVVRAKRPQYRPVVLTRDEVRAVLARLDGVRATPSAIRSPLTSWKRATTSALSKSCSVTGTSARR